MKPVKLQRLGGPEGATRKLTVPANIARMIPDGTTFEVELTDDGLLYRPVDVPPSEPMPEWLQRG